MQGEWVGMVTDLHGECGVGDAMHRGHRWRCGHVKYELHTGAVLPAVEMHWPSTMAEYMQLNHARRMGWHGD